MKRGPESALKKSTTQCPLQLPLVLPLHPCFTGAQPASHRAFHERLFRFSLLTFWVSTFTSISRLISEETEFLVISPRTLRTRWMSKSKKKKFRVTYFECS